MKAPKIWIVTEEYQFIKNTVKIETIINNKRNCKNTCACGNIRVEGA